jgi:two-component system nitrate/nitrite response regulator NarL
MSLSLQKSPASPLPVDRRATVLIADDHPLFRRGIARAVRRHPRLELVGEAVDGVEALALIDVLEPDVAVLDLRMPGLTGTQVCAELRRRRGARPAVLILTAFDDAPLVRSAAAAGAAGYVSKAASQGEICGAIEHVARGGLAYEVPGDARPASIADDAELF